MNGPLHSCTETVAPLMAAMLLGLASPVLAQTPPAPPAADAIKQRDKELEAVRAEQKRSAEQRAKLQQDVDAIGADRAKLNQALIDTAARIRAVEERITAGETRLKPLDDGERTLRVSLEDRRGVIADVLAALQRMGRRPPPAVIVKPEDALESVRTAMVLGAVLPEMRQQAESLATDLASLVQIRKEIQTERERARLDLAALSEEQQRLTALQAERQKQQAEAEKSLEAERQRAAQLARQAGDIKELLAKLEQGLDPATRAARAAARATEEGTSLAALSNPGRLAPAMAFVAAKGLLPLPVNGAQSHGFGVPDGLGGTEKGLSVTTRPGAQVTSPCDGWVMYAAPYRSYGQLLILNAGGGYHVLLAGMERFSVDVGQFVLTGEPVAVMGSGPQVASAVAAGVRQPVLYIEFRKDGVPIDPAPWWVTHESEKVRG